MITTVNTFKLNGMDGIPVECEVEITPGIGIHLVGLADEAVKESLLRTLTAMQSLGYRVPGKKVVINLAPADLRKSGCGYDLPIAVGVIAASGQTELPELDKYVLSGELGLDGSIRHIPGWMQCADVAKSTGKACIMPRNSAELAARALRDSVAIYGVSSLQDAIKILSGKRPSQTAWEEYLHSGKRAEYPVNVWDTIRGQDAAKRALEIAAAGGHSVIMMGAPGSGKTQLTNALADILPPMNEEESNEVQRIFSADDKTITPGVRPVRHPHYSASMAAWLGGGAGESIKPGEVSLAHNGILCIDEMQCMPKSCREALRGPIEDKQVTISRLRSKVTYPADFLTVVLSNPCPCGYYGVGDKCTCTPTQRQRYLSMLDGPILDRVAMQLYVSEPMKPAPGVELPLGESSSVVAERVAKARERQLARQGKLNDRMEVSALMQVINFAPNTDDFADDIMCRLGLSMRAYTRILRISRTIADLEGSEQVECRHIAEAASYRFLDRKLF